MRAFLRRFLLVGALALALCSAKLLAVSSYLSEFPRTLYPLPGVSDVSSLLRILLDSLFRQPPDELVRAALVNSRWTLKLHDFEFGITWVPLVILIACGLAGIYRFRSARLPRGIGLERWGHLTLMFTLLLVPLALNFYTPAWNGLLKQMPVLKSSVTLFRWFSVYIPIVVLIACIGVQRTPVLHRHRLFIVVAGISIALGLNMTRSRKFYYQKGHDPARVLAAYDRTGEGRWVPAITAVTVYVDRWGRETMSRLGNEALVHGESQLLCYEAIFGYRLENFPRQSLRPGAPLEEANGVLNLKNAACYVFPRENHCVPGDHFRSDQREEALALTRYRGFSFGLPMWQRAANLLSLISLLGTAAFLTAYAVASVYRTGRGRLGKTGGEKPDTLVVAQR